MILLPPLVHGGHYKSLHHTASLQYNKIEDENKVDIVIETLINFAIKVRQTHHEEHTLNNSDMLDFHQEMAKKFLQRDWLSLYTLVVENKIIAILYCYSYNNTIYYYQTGYDLDWKKYGPGRQILAYCVAQAIAEGTKELDFMRGEHAYKEHWANEIKKDRCVKVAYSPYGLLLVTIYKVWDTIRRSLASFVKT